MALTSTHVPSEADRLRRILKQVRAAYALLAPSPAPLEERVHQARTMLAHVLGEM